MNNINQIIKTFFNDVDLFDESEVSVIRNDGIVVFSTIENDLDKASVGALVSGLWQAAFSVSAYIDRKPKEEDFRLSFDTSKSGINIIPITVNNKTFFFCTLFKESINPAKLKQKMKVISNELENYVKTHFVQEEPTEQREGYLFQNITDEEMDRLFNF